MKAPEKIHAWPSSDAAWRLGYASDRLDGPSTSGGYVRHDLYDAVVFDLRELRSAARDLLDAVLKAQSSIYDMEEIVRLQSAVIGVEMLLPAARPTTPGTGEGE